MPSPGTAVAADGRRIHVDTEDLCGRRLIESGGDLNPNSLRLWSRVVEARD